MKTILITGAGGEVGHGLIEYYAEQRAKRPAGLSAAEAGVSIVAIDQRVLDPAVARLCDAAYECDITDADAIKRIGEKHRFDTVFHLAAILSSGGERNPIKAQEVNVNGSFNLLVMCREQAERFNFSPTFIFPSSIAAYGVQTLQEKESFGTMSEEQCLNPITIYGINKLGVEQLGRYFSHNYQLLSATETRKIDFRAVRFPGLVSPDTLPTGGTSDYFSEMIHAAAAGQPYECFVRQDTTLPFMAMYDAVQALVRLASAPREKLTKLVYNVTSFPISALEISSEVKRFFPDFSVRFVPHLQRQRIVDSWPSNMDDHAARRDWGWSPTLSREKTFEEYLIPRISARYAGQSTIQTLTPGQTLASGQNPGNATREKKTAQPMLKQCANG